MIKDQILFGTRDTEVRKAALKEDWDVTTLLKKGRAMEASTLGMALIKVEPTDEVRRTKPGRFSAKIRTTRRSENKEIKKTPIAARQPPNVKHVISCV